MFSNEAIAPKIFWYKTPLNRKTAFDPERTKAADIRAGSFPPSPLTAITI